MVDEQILSVTNHINQTTQADLAVDQETLGVVNQINQTTQDDLAVDQEIRDIVSQIQDCSCTCQVILPEDFMDGNGVLSQTVVLDKPGQYCLRADIDFEPLVSATPAIQILANDVTLDLGGHTLRQINTTADAVGVRLGNVAGTLVYKNITVKNGSIVTFIGMGVGAFNSVVASSSAFQDLHFSDLEIYECGTNTTPFFGVGLNLDSNGSANLDDPVVPVAYKNVTIENVHANRCVGTAVIEVRTGENVVLRNCQANDASQSGNRSLFAYGLQCRNLQMYSCQGNNARSTATTATGNQVGGLVGRSYNVYAVDCQFNNIFGEACFLAQGANVSNVQNAIFENCQFNNARGGNTSTVVTAIHASDGAFQQTQGNGMKFINCQFNGASRSSTGNGIAADLFGCYGPTLITTRNIEFIGCQACNIATDNPTFLACGFFLKSDLEDPLPFYANNQNITVTDCLASDISSPNVACGFAFGVGDAHRTGQQGAFVNAVIKNSVAERIYSSSSTSHVFGIGEYLSPSPGTTPFARALNLFVDHCRVSNVRSNFATPSPLSAGILAQSVKRPVITDNSVSDCDRGILLTGTSDIYPSNLFQLASSQDNSLASPPIAIDLKGILTYSTGTASQSGTTVTGVGTAFTSAMIGGTISFGSVAGTGSQAADIVTATAAVFTSSMVGSTISFPNGYTTYIVGYVSPTVVKVSTTLPVSAPLPPAQAFTINVNIAPITNVNVGAQTLTVSKSQTITPAQSFTITYGFPASAPLQTFTNTVVGRGGPVSLAPSSTTIDLNRDYLLPAATNLNFGGGVQQWQSGDMITYSNGGGTSIGNLANGNYYLIVYTPGYSENGVIKDNVVDNCSVSGYEDTRPVTTTSAWINNVAMNNGTPCIDATNYDIVWSPGPYPVDSGFVGGPYPAGTNKWINMSLKP